MYVIAEKVARPSKIKKLGKLESLRAPKKKEKLTVPTCIW